MGEHSGDLSSYGRSRGSQAVSSQEGVQVGGLSYTENADGTRNYPQQEPVETSEDPTPTPEVKDSGIQEVI